MIERNEGYYVYGTLSTSDQHCKDYSYYNNVLYFMSWIKKIMNTYEYSQCQTQDWARRSNKKWIARIKDGCLKGKHNCLDADDS